jgi:hypothetical protein
MFTQQQNLAIYIQSELEHEQSLNKTRQSQYITIVLLLQGQPFYNEKVIL